MLLPALVFTRERRCPCCSIWDPCAPFFQSRFVISRSSPKDTSCVASSAAHCPTAPESTNANKFHPRWAWSFWLTKGLMLTSVSSPQSRPHKSQSASLDRSVPTSFFFLRQSARKSCVQFRRGRLRAGLQDFSSPSALRRAEKKKTTKVSVSVSSIAVKRVVRDVMNVSRTKIQTHRHWRSNHKFLADLIISSLRTDASDFTMRECSQNPLRTFFTYTSISKGCPQK